MNRAPQLKSFRTDFITPVTEENAIRAVAIMAERMAGLGVDELILPENRFEELLDATRPPDETDEDPGEVGADELDEERIPEKIKEPTKRASGKKKKVESKRDPPETVLYKLVGFPYSHPYLWLTAP